MIEPTQLGNKLRELLLTVDSLHECFTVEFKVVSHKRAFICEFYKDILGLLNNVERPSEDRWLVFAVSDKSHRLIGVERDHPDLLDDASCQQLFDKISPRPHIEFAKLNADGFANGEARERVFAALCIPADLTQTLRRQTQRTRLDQQLRAHATRDVIRDALRHQPLEASSGKTIRHRLKRGGTRRAIRVLHSIAVSMMSSDVKISEYMAKRISEGKSRREAIRCLKCYVTRGVYRALMSPTA